MKTCILSGILTAVSPIAVSPPGVEFHGDKEGEHPKRLPRTGARYTASRYLPASTFRHVIRYGLASVVLESLKASGRNDLPLSTILALSSGFNKMKLSTKGKNGKKGKEKNGNNDTDASQAADKAPDTIETSKNEKAEKENQKSAADRLASERRVRERNPLYAMLGAWGLPSELRVGNAFPRNEGRDTFTETPGVVRKPLSDDIVATLTDDDLRQYEALLDESADKNKKNTGIKYFAEAGWEEIVAGTQCDWSIHIHRATDLKVGAVLAALRAFAAEPVIGAHKAAGRGEVALALGGRFVDQQFLDVPRSVLAGDLTLRFGEFRVTGELERCLAVFDEQARAGFPDLDFNEIHVVKPEDN